MWECVYVGGKGFSEIIIIGMLLCIAEVERPYVGILSFDFAFAASLYSYS